MKDSSENTYDEELRQGMREMNEEDMASEDDHSSIYSMEPTKDKILGQEGPYEIAYRDRLAHSTLGYMFFSTDQGHMGLVQGDASPGDLVAIVQGSDVPLILRRQDYSATRGTGGNFYTLVGASYVHGIMDGEAVSDRCDLTYSKIHIQ